MPLTLKITYWWGSVFALRQILIKNSVHTAHEWGTPQPVFTLMDQQPMAQLAQYTRQTEAVCTRQIWKYTLAHHGALRLLRSMRGLPRRKYIPGLSDIGFTCVRFQSRSASARTCSAQLAVCKAPKACESENLAHFLTFSLVFYSFLDDSLSLLWSGQRRSQSS